MLEEEYNLEYFKINNFERKRCPKCGSYFWTRDKDRITCGDAPCDPYSFIGNPLFKDKYSLDEMREKFLSFFEENDHTRIERYPVVARWRDDIYLTIASIADFQPFVTSGKVRPPANPLTISQPCIRLEDIDSVGKTGRHLTTFEMMAHHAFNYPSKKIYWKEETVAYCEKFLERLGADLNKITYKEEPWAGGGNAGPCLEVLLGGLELATLVFMSLVRNDDGDILIKGEKYKKMENCIVDTGYGLERFVWMSQGTPTIYDALFPEIIEKIIVWSNLEDLSKDPAYNNILAQNARLSGVLSASKGEEITILRKKVAESLGINLNHLEKVIKPLEKVYAISDYSRCITYMLGDGIVPSNVKAGYLARLVIRRAFRLMDELNLDIDLYDIVFEHAKMIKEFSDKLDVIREILDIEREKYDDTIKNGKRLALKRAREYKGKDGLPLPVLIDLYDTYGIPPEIVKEVLKDETDLILDIPDNFYSLVAQMHAKEEKHKRDNEEDKLKDKLSNLPKTERLYYVNEINAGENLSTHSFDAKVLDIIDDLVVLDKTLFYPEGGGQPADSGFLVFNDRSVDVLDVKSIDGVIIHKISDAGFFKRGMDVKGIVDLKTRLAYTRHHTATHIVLEAAKRTLGRHIWQAGAQKEKDRARLDISHYKKISEDEIKMIELVANEIVMSNIKVDCEWMDRVEAEKRYGFSLYQGGVPAGDTIRVVKIGDNVQACAGTHCSYTGEVGFIKIIKVERIQDGVERLEFSAGEAAVRSIQAMEDTLKEASSVLKVPPEILPKTVKRFFDEWKEFKKDNERLKEDIARLNAKNLLKNAIKVKDYCLISEKIDLPLNEMMKISQVITINNKSDDKIILILGNSDGDLVVSLSRDIEEREIDASGILNKICASIDGTGGGKRYLAQGKSNPEKIDEGLNLGKKIVMELIG